MERRCLFAGQNRGRTWRSFRLGCGPGLGFGPCVRNLGLQYVSLCGSDGAECFCILFKHIGRHGLCKLAGFFRNSCCHITSPRDRANRTLPINGPSTELHSHYCQGRRRYGLSGLFKPLPCSIALQPWQRPQNLSRYADCRGVCLTHADSFRSSCFPLSSRLRCIFF